jgi:hypothetical protein
VSTSRNGRMLRNFVCLGGLGLLLASCSPNEALITQSQRVQREEAACHLIGTPPKLPKLGRGAFFVVAVKTSLLSALRNSDDAPLEDVGQELRTAGAEESKTGDAMKMVRALDEGVKICRHLGLSTTK